MNQEKVKIKSAVSFAELPFYQLMELKMEDMGEEELRKYLNELNLRSGSPQTQRSRQVKQSDKLSGKKVQKGGDFNLEKWS